MAEERCRLLMDDDGQPVAHYLGGDLDERGRMALLEIVEWVREHRPISDEQSERQRLALRRIHLRRIRHRPPPLAFGGAYRLRQIARRKRRIR